MIITPSPLFACGPGFEFYLIFLTGLAVLGIGAIFWIVNLCLITTLSARRGCAMHGHVALALLFALTPGLVWITGDGHSFVFTMIVAHLIPLMVMAQFVALMIVRKRLRTGPHQLAG